MGADFAHLNLELAACRDSREGVDLSNEASTDIRFCDDPKLVSGRLDERPHIYVRLDRGRLEMDF